MMNRSPSFTAAIFSLAAASLALVTFTGCNSQPEPLPWELEEGDEENNHQEDSSGSAESLVLFDQQVTLAGGYTPSITVELPENVLSMTITVSDGNPAAQFGVTGWIGPDGFEVVPNNWEQSSQSGICYPNCNNRIFPWSGAFAAIAPNNPASRVEPGEYSFRAFGVIPSGTSASPASGQVRIQVHAKVVQEEVPETGVLDLNLFFTGAGGWTAESAQTDPSFQAMLEGLDRIYSQVGISIGEVSYSDVDPSFQVIEDITSGDGDLGTLLLTSADAPLNGPSVYFVDDLRSAGGFFGMVAGVSPGIPGPIQTKGTPSSGVAIAVGSLDDPQIPFTFEQLVGHEIGHHLGLFHTTEGPFAQIFPGIMPAHDPLPDTPENDDSYLMFYSGSGSTLSPWQGRVMRKNPWVQHR